MIREQFSPNRKRKLLDRAVVEEAAGGDLVPARRTLELTRAAAASYDMKELVSYYVSSA